MSRRSRTSTGTLKLQCITAKSYVLVQTLPRDLESCPPIPFSFCDLPPYRLFPPTSFHSTMAAGVVVNVHNNDDDVPTEGSRTYAIIVCVFAALGGLFFGYDQGVTSGVLIMDSFIRRIYIWSLTSLVTP
ncbi:hypothetical protein GN958_ATG07589 [Phytophthora infestans]|uniref:Major facilitator superfamily (MFS) profile domain-containing protein n=2 Tax=Phytophthora infestans TaxID=4787 RepID=A0A8S9UYQ9_PHYIN|nr:hypothetical protein GN958_ATG07589 [Phytophthora infestans]